ncbi:RING finger and CCCH-type zinc finger domain-containing protein roquin isoform X2 [Lycorma delicatula]|uniref:RING finger and CCCH-type zinc finger domain-containing protein roquin isoform X2 n=1 Tax=Lycorma delicatula TaxID=130591 RepID=UPI003F50E1F5
MPIQAPQWTEFLSCPVCCNEFDATVRSPISLGCAHTVCKTCLSNLHRKQCPFDQTVINTEIESLPVNCALLKLVGATLPEEQIVSNVSLNHLPQEDLHCYLQAKKCIEELALYLKPFSSGNGGTGVLSRPMQRKLVTLINCQLMEEEGRSRAMRAARSLGERTVTELILQHQNPQQLSANLWAAVRARGCQFLGPAMQEEVLKLVLLALEDGTALSRKVLVMFVVQRLEPHFPQASKTSIGHVVQLLYRASCFKVSKREGDSSLMQLKEEFRTYEALRREHDAQIVQIATEAGLRIAPDQWSALLYGDATHKSHMQSIIDKLQTPQSFAQSVQELVIALQRTGDPENLSILRPHLELLAAIDPTPENNLCSWREVWRAVEGARVVVAGLVEFIRVHGSRKAPPGEPPSHPHNAKYKISLCRDLTLRGNCPRGANCTFAHSEDELDKYRAKNRKMSSRNNKDDELVNVTNDSILDEMLFTSQTPSFTSRNDCVNEFTNAFPLTGAPLHSPYQPAQQQMFPPTPGTYTPDIYSAAPHSMILSSGGQVFAPQPDYAAPAPPQSTDHRPIEPAWLPPTKVQRVSSKSLAALQQRRQELISQLERVGKCSPTTNKDNLNSTSTYSIWNGGGILHTSTGTNSHVSHISSARPMLFRPDSVLTDDEFVPFDFPIVSKYGPISRTAVRPALQTAAPFTDGTIATPTPTLRRPLPAPSPVAAWVFNNPQGYPATAHIMAAPTPATLGDGFITIGHGIIDPPQIFSTQRTDTISASKEIYAESQKVKQQIRSLEKKINDLKLQGAVLTESEKLSQELQLIEHGIREKEKELKLTQMVSCTPVLTNLNWNNNNNNNNNNREGWNNTDYRSDDEDSYEAGIANDIKELELRWEFELEEHEKRWSSEEDSIKK